MLKTIWNSLQVGVVTTRYPQESIEPPRGFRGAPEIVAGRSFAQLPAPSVCPSGAITASEAGDRYGIDLAQCLFCGRCSEPSGQSPIATGRRFELAARRRDDLVDRVTHDPEGRTVVVESADDGPPPERVAEAIRRTLGRSLHLRHLDAGSCNACDWELTALLNPVYDVRRLGIDFVASPRHADGVIVTGSVTRNLELAVQRTYEAVPEPRIVIAVGACASSGGIVGRGYASAGGVASILPVDVFIPGCPPRPEAIVFGILVAIGRLEARRGQPRTGR
jgi:Ni,Fe-hydrogenase III small subunit/formate hydrogenlyase subunit 6/NADH:ubiquinone oxidoreductase subunit I